MGTRAQWLLTALLACASPLFMAFASPVQPGADAALSPPDGGATVADIIVTAQRRAEHAQDAPLTVTAVSASELDALKAKDLFEVVTLVPGVVFSRAPDDGIALTFLGLGTLTRSSELEQSIALVQDGVPLAKGRLYSNALFDVDQMEFIKGDQATLFGKNSSLGAITLADRQPGRIPAFEASAGYEAADGGYTLDAADDAPLGAHASLRLAAHYNDLDGWVHNSATDHDGPEQKDTGFRATLHAELRPDLTLTAFYQFGDSRQIGYSMQLVSPALPPQYGDGAFDDRNDQFTSQTADGDSLHRTTAHTASVKAEWRTRGLTLSSQTSFVHYDLFFADDLDFSSDDTVTLVRNEHYDQIAQELRLQSPSGNRVQYSAGFLYLGSHWKSTEDQLWRVPDFPPPPSPISGQLFNGLFLNTFYEDTDTYSLYGSGSWRITPRLILAGGLRATRETKDDLFGRTPQGPLTIWNTIANPPFDPTPLSHLADFIDGNASLRYLITRDVSAYASYGRGSKAGGFVETDTIAVPTDELVDGKVPADLVAASAALKDEVAQTYEVGVKSLLLHRSVKLNLAIFHTDVRNFQDTVFTGGSLGFITYNEPARSYGGELDSAWSAGHGLNFSGGLTYAEATAVIQPLDASGAPEVGPDGAPVYRRFQRTQAPKFIANQTTSYVRPLPRDLELRLEAGVRYRGPMFNQRQDAYRSPALTTLDLVGSVGPRNGRWSLSLAARNVTDAISQDFASATPDPRFAAFYGAYAASPNRLRTVTLSASIKY